MKKVILSLILALTALTAFAESTFYDGPRARWLTVYMDSDMKVQLRVDNMALFTDNGERWAAGRIFDHKLKKRIQVKWKISGEDCKAESGTLYSKDSKGNSSGQTTFRFRDEEDPSSVIALLACKFAK